MATKDEKNLQECLDKISKMDEPARSVMQRMHDVITEAAPQLKARIWYGMPGYALHASSPVLVFFRNDDIMTLGISEKAELKPAGGKDGLLIPAAWYFEALDDVTEQRVAEIVRSVVPATAHAAVRDTN
ncbi:MAG TPA: DUF1801 domain-containing protein [Enteractinococcus sp.]